jgi:hypothetical protein
MEQQLELVLLLEQGPGLVSLEQQPRAPWVAQPEVQLLSGCWPPQVLQRSKTAPNLQDHPESSSCNKSTQMNDAPAR